MSETLLPAASFSLPAPGVGINPWFLSHSDALAHAQGQAFNLLQRQDSFLAFLDCFTALSWFALKPLSGCGAHHRMQIRNARSQPHAYP